jgi:hypothetical protein
VVEQFAIADDLERERVLEGASSAQLEALVAEVNRDVLDLINRYLDETDDAEEAVPFGDLAQAVMEARGILDRPGRA